MDKVSGKLTVFFEEPFWVGVFERVSDGKLSVCKQFELKQQKRKEKHRGR